MKFPENTCLRGKWVVTCLLVALAAWPSWARAADLDEEAALAALGRLHQMIALDVEALRGYMGGPKSRPLLLKASNVQPPDLHAQALEFHRKAERLRFEHLRLLPEQSLPPGKATRYEDSLALLQESRAMIQQVMEFYGLPKATYVEPAVVDPARPRDVYNSVRSSGRQLNLVLDEQLSPSDTYMTVVQAIGYASRLLAKNSTAKRIPDEPAYEAGKAPHDVWDRLLRCLNMVESIYERWGLSSLHASVREDISAEILPVDVNDLANLLTSRLAFLVSLDPGLEPPPEPVYPGRRFPSHVDVKASVLESQLAQLLQLEANSGK